MTGIIKKVFAREVLNEKGLPTLEVDVLLDDGSLGRAAAPGGTSRGLSEAFDLRDGDPSYFNGWGVKKAIFLLTLEIARHPTTRCTMPFSRPSSFRGSCVFCPDVEYTPSKNCS